MLLLLLLCSKSIILNKYVYKTFHLQVQKLITHDYESFTNYRKSQETKVFFHINWIISLMLLVKFYHHHHHHHFHHQGLVTARVPLTISLSLVIRLYRLSLMLSHKESMQCPHRVVECKFWLVGHHCCAHEQDSTGERRSWVRPFFLPKILASSY